jgi:hypothetical protein
MRRLSVAAVVLLAGCTPTLDPYSVAGPATEADLRAFYARRYDALAQAYTGAYDATPAYAPAALQVWDKASYVDHYAKLMTSLHDVFYLQSRGDACVAALSGVGNVFDYLATVNDPSGACRNTLVGQVPRGEPCKLTSECGPHDFCQLNVCPGVCVARATAGQSCGLTLCDYGLTCATVNSVSTCVPSLVGVGQPCGLSALCAAGLACKTPAGSTTAVCTAPVPQGGDCSAASTSFCDNHSACVNGTCKARVGPGSPCGPGVGVCMTGVACVGGTCVAPVAVGASCNAATGPFCADSVCYNGVCTEPLDDGATCSPTGIRCKFTSCDPVTSTCTPSCR